MCYGFLLLGLFLSVFAEAGAITGTVKDPKTGKLLAGAEVSLIAVTKGCPSSQILTDELGRFHFDKLPHGAYRIDVFKIGFEKITYGQTNDNPVGQELIVTPTSSPENLEILLPYGAGVAGHIYDESGLAIPKCYVFLDPVGITNKGFHVMTDQNGYYWAASLPAGAYIISARKYSAARHQVEGDRWYYPQTVNEKQATPVSLVAGKTATIDIRFGEDRVAKWIGTVLNSKGMPVARADLEITKWDGTQFLSENICRTGPKGTCENRDLAEGDYWIFLSRAPHPYSGWMAADIASVPHRYGKKVKIKEGSIAQTQFRLNDGQTVQGHLYMEDGSYASDGMGVTLWLQHFWSHKTTRRSVETSPSALKQGQFNIPGVLPELDYEIRVGSRDPNRRYCVRKLAWNGQPLSDTNVVRMVKGETPRLEAWLVRAAALSGVAPNGGHVQLERMNAQLFEAQIYPDIQFSDYVEQNRFYIPGIPPGQYRVRVERTNRMLEITLQPGEVKELNLNH